MCGAWENVGGIEAPEFWAGTLKKEMKCDVPNYWRTDRGEDWFPNKVQIHCTANVFAVNFTGFPYVPLKPCKVQVNVTGKGVKHSSLWLLISQVPVDFYVKLYTFSKSVLENFNANLYKV